MSLYIDQPIWPAHGTRWAHLVSDDSLAELHRFAAHAGIPARAFDGDHYDVPAVRRRDIVNAGAREVGTRQMVGILAASGLRASRPRSAKARYRSREISLAAGTVGSRGDAPGDPAPPGYDAAASAPTLGQLLGTVRAMSPTVDAVVIASGPRARRQHDAVRADASSGGGQGRRSSSGLQGPPDILAIDGRSRFRHGSGAFVLGRVHWADDLPDVRATLAGIGDAAASAGVGGRTLNDADDD